MPSTKPSTPPEPAPKRVLVIDRKPDDLDRLYRYLVREGYEITEGKTGQEVKKLVAAGKVDLLVIDASDPEVDGSGICESLHSKPGTATIPIIAITDPKGTEDGMTALNVGADDFIPRPLEMASLLVRAKMLVRSKELRDGVLLRNKQLKQVNAELGRVNRELAHRNTELERGLEMAHRLQEALLPQEYPRVQNISFSHLYTPADVVGGDLFQITGMAGNRAAMLVSDVSGHGIRAALITSIIKTVSQHVYLEDKTPAEVLCDMNSRFRSVLGSLSPDIFATACMVIVDGPARSISLASAGHPCPLLIRKDDMSCRATMESEEIGPALGFFRAPEYPTVECQLKAGDIVLGYTDGAYEVMDEEGEMYGLPRLEELVAHNARLIPRDLIQKIITETDTFRGSRPRRDDTCIVTLEVH